MTTQKFKITGLHCKSCETITKNVFNEYGNATISDIQVDAHEGMITISYEGILDIISIQRELAEMDYMLNRDAIV